MKKLLLMLLMGAIFGCGKYVTVPLKGQYPKPPYVVEAKGDYEQTWGRLIDLFAQNNFSIRIVDKQSGLIILNRSDMRTSYDVENSKGELVNKNRYVVVSRCYNKERGEVWPVNELSLEWNVRVKTEGGKTFVNINMVNVVMVREMKSNSMSIRLCPDAEVKSTGLLERQIVDSI